MKAYIFFSIHEELFHRIALLLRDRGVDSFSGFVWSQRKEQLVRGRGIDYDPLTVFTRDLLPLADDGRAPDLAWLERRERELGVSLQRMLMAERHMIAGRSFEQIMRMAEVGLRAIGDAYDRIKPDFIYSDDVSCFHSYAHLLVARERKIPYWCISSGRMPGRIAVYSTGLQYWDRLYKLYPELRMRGLSDLERTNAEAFLTTFREKPIRPTGMATRGRRPRIGLADAKRLRQAASNFYGDRNDPTAIRPTQAIRQRLTRMARVAVTDTLGVFEEPVAGEKFILYPIHFQPEASTLVQAPMYLDQVALLRDLAASLPAGHRLYVKEHVSNRGRRTLSFYNAIREIPAVRLLGPDTNTWNLIRDSSAVAVITGTMGWEGLLFKKPVNRFGGGWFNPLPQAHRRHQVSRPQPLPTTACRRRAVSRSPP